MTDLIEAGKIIYQYKIIIPDINAITIANNELNDIDMDNFFSDDDEFASAPAPLEEDQKMNDGLAQVSINQEE
jgi:hypothetical protein